MIANGLPYYLDFSNSHEAQQSYHDQCYKLACFDYKHSTIHDSNNLIIRNMTKCNILINYN